MINLKVLKRLGELFSFKTADEIDEFLVIIDEIASERDPDYLPFLFAFLKDDFEYIAVEETLIMAIEYYPAKAYILYLLKNIKNQFQRTPDICKILLWGIFNSSEHLNVLKENIQLADKKTLLKLFDNIDKDKSSLEHHKKVIKELRELVNKK